MNTLPSIGLMGRKQSGKNAVASALAKNGYTELAFADPLRMMALRLNPIIDGAANMRYSDALEEFGYDLAKELYPEIRRFLQVLGTDAVREVLGDTLWVDNLIDRLIMDNEPHVVTDVRFPNEAQAIRRDGGKLVRVVRPGVPSDDRHVSETALDDYRVDYVATNGGSLDDLRNVADHLAWWLGEQA